MLATNRKRVRAIEPSKTLAIRTVTDEELAAYLERGRQLHAQAVREGFVAVGLALRGLFRQALSRHYMAKDKHLAGCRSS